MGGRALSGIRACPRGVPGATLGTEAITVNRPRIRARSRAARGVRLAVLALLGALTLGACAGLAAGGDGASAGAPSRSTPPSSTGTDPSTSTESPATAEPNPSPEPTAPDGPTPSDGPSSTGGPSAAPGTAAASLTITLDETGTGRTSTTTLTCSPAGGTHPDPTAACAAVVAAGGVPAFAPLPRTAVCTEIYGGPQRASVVGTVDGVPVDARFSRVNGCEIARWDRLAVVLGSTGGV